MRKREPQLQAAEQSLAQGDAAHDHNAGRRAQKPDEGRDDEVVGRDHYPLWRNNAELSRRKRLRDEVADQCGDGDWRQAVGRVAADDELEPVEGTGQWRAEGSRDTASRAATDQYAKVGPPQPKCHADARRYAAGKLRVAGLEPDRSSDTARPHRFRRNNDAAEKRHAAAMQRIGFDRIDLPLRPPAGDQLARDAEYETADQRDRNGDRRIEPEHPRQAHARLKLEE